MSDVTVRDGRALGGSLWASSRSTHPDGIILARKARVEHGNARPKAHRHTGLVFLGRRMLEQPPTQKMRIVTSQQATEQTIVQMFNSAIL